MPVSPDLQILEVDLEIATNSRHHRTDEYDLSETCRHLVVRRGQTFDISITFNKSYDPESDDLKLVFLAGMYKHVRRMNISVTRRTNTRSSPPLLSCLAINTFQNDNLNGLLPPMTPVRRRYSNIRSFCLVTLDFLGKSTS